MTGIAFAHGTVADLTSPSSMPVHMLEFKKAANSSATNDSALRSAIVDAANYFLHLAQGKTPGEMEALIWQNDSLDGTDHGESCAAFASLALEAGAHATGQQSWVTGGTSYPWPLHGWVDARVDPNPASPGIISILQDAEAHQRWHPLGDGYIPQPGDWVLFAGHVEVVTKYAGGVLYTIGGDSMPNFSVNAHQYDDPLSAQGVAGFVNNGELLSAVSQSPAAAPEAPRTNGAQPEVRADQPQPAIPGLLAPAFIAAGQQAAAAPTAQGAVSGAQSNLPAGADIPGAQAITGNFTHAWSTPSGPRYGRSQHVPSTAGVPGTAAQRAFISEVAAGAVTAQQRYGIPASVTIAQAIDESGWGQSQLATQDHNLFGIKGSGPAGSVNLPTQEYVNGQWVSTASPFRVYNNVAESIEDHSLLLATGSVYKQAMADRNSPDAFANDLTGVYATDPSYGSNLITIMRLYNLYRYDAGPTTAQGASSHGGTRQGTATQAATGKGAAGQRNSGQSPSRASQGATGQPTIAPGTTGQGTAGRSATEGDASDPASPAQGATGRSSAGRGANTRGTGGQGTTGQGYAGQGGDSDGGISEDGTSHGTVAQSAAGQRGATPGTGGQGTAGQGTAGQGTAGQGTAGQGTGGQGTTGQGTTGQGTTGRGAGVPRQLEQGTAGGAALGQARIPGLLQADSSRPVKTSPSVNGPSGQAAPSRRAAVVQAGPRNGHVSTKRYQAQMPSAVTTAFITTAKTPLMRAQPLYQDVASASGIHWELLAACDWMQCQAQPRYSPVHGEKLGSKNSDGTVYRSKSEALAQAASDLVVLASVVYRIDLTRRVHLSVRDLANVFAAFRWGGLLRAYHISAMEFPYSVAGLTSQHLRMRWPEIPEPHAPDKPGARFPGSFGAVPVVLGLGFPAVA
jgi:Mannosyl-glycoprotein endo-beta-N-acetylglucosaminidase